MSMASVKQGWYLLWFECHWTPVWIVDSIVGWAIRHCLLPREIGPCLGIDPLVYRLCTLECLYLLASFRFFVNLRIIIVTIIVSRHFSSLKSNPFCVGNCASQFASQMFDLFVKLAWTGWVLAILTHSSSLLEYPSRNLVQVIVYVVNQWICCLIAVVSWVHPELVCLGSAWHLDLEHPPWLRLLAAPRSRRR